MDPLETQRLLLVPQSAEDAPFLCQLMNSEGWLKYIGDRGVRTVTDALHYMQHTQPQQYSDGAFGFFIVRLKGSGEPVGVCCLAKRPALAYMDLGFAFMPEHTGKGYGFEAASVVMQTAIRDLNPDAIVAITLPDNTASVRLLNKLGLRYREPIVFPGSTESLSLFQWNAER